MPITAALTRCHFQPPDPVAGLHPLLRWARALCEARRLAGATLFDGETAGLLLAGPGPAVGGLLDELPRACPAVVRVERVVAEHYPMPQLVGWRDGYAEPDELAELAARFGVDAPARVVDDFMRLLDAAERR